MQQPVQRHPAARSGLAHPYLLGATIVAAPVLWILFTASTRLHELAVGLVACAATLVFTVFVCHSSATSLTLRPADILQAWRIPAYIASGVWEILVVLAQDLLHLAPPQNLFRVSGFDTSKRDPVRLARTVLAVAYATSAPNFIVLDIDPAQSRMLFHQIRRSAVPPIATSLGARG